MDERTIEAMLRQAFEAGADSVHFNQRAPFEFHAMVSSHLDLRDDEGRSVHKSAHAHGEGPTPTAALADALGKLKRPVQIEEARERARQSALARKVALAALPEAERKTS